MSANPSQYPSVNCRFTLASRPVGLPEESDFRLTESRVRALQEGEVLLRALYLSVDPAMRIRIGTMKSYAAPTELGALMEGGGIAEVIATRNPSFAVGELIQTWIIGWQQFAISKGEGLNKIDLSLGPVAAHMCVLGGIGLSAYFGLLEVCNPKAGETVVVSGAAGAVGSIVGQIAKIKGCRVVGIAGSDEKINYIVNECGYDAGFNYKTTADYEAKLKELCPNGIDVYFDNVGGPITDAIFGLLNRYARISICGQISQYSNTKVEVGPRFLFNLIFSSARIKGFLASDYISQFGPALVELAGWVKSGRIKYRADIVEGFENLPRAFIGMLQGENTGKRFVKV
jgi:NADPH-dependent curcumin reductase CurA